MKIFKKINKNYNLSVALGFFDGVHIAHQKLIKEAVKCAKENTLKSAVITFAEHPLKILMGYDIKYLYNIEEKAKMIEELGVDYLYILDFEEFKNQSAIDYLNFLHQNISPKFIITGFNHTFGKNQQGTPEFLEKNQDKFNYIYKKIEPVYIKDELVSTTKIKEKLSNCDIYGANKLLGRNFKIQGKVIEGAKIGRTLGFPTINIKWQENIFKLPYGVYKGKVLGQNALINWGLKPTINSEELIEAHILNFKGDLYGKNLDIFFEEKIRNEKKFKNLDELKLQIQKDIKSF